MLQKNPYTAYSRATHTVSKTRQIVMLYDGAIRSVAQAKEALERGDIMEKFNKLVNAGDIIMGLQASLDFENGGEVSKALYDFYSYVDSRILNMHRSTETKGYDLLISELKQLRNEWSTIDEGKSETKAEIESPTPPAFSEDKEYSLESEESLKESSNTISQPDSTNNIPLNSLSMNA